MPYAFNPLTGQFDFYKDPTPGGTSGQVQFNNSGVLGGVSTTQIDGSGNLTFSGRLIQTTNGASNAAPYNLTGSWFSGGTSTTTKPQLLIEPTGTTSNTWNTAGTGLGVNAPSGFGGDLAWLGVNGTGLFGVNSSGRVSVPLGTAALPSLYPGTDTNTGSWSPTADTLAWSTAGSERMRVTATGNVGIGTSSPGVLLEVNGAMTAQGNIFAASGGTTRTITLGPAGAGLEYNTDGTTYLGGRTDAYPLAFRTNSAERMRIDSSGRVSIGANTNPTGTTMLGIACPAPGISGDSVSAGAVATATNAYRTFDFGLRVTGESSEALNYRSSIVFTLNPGTGGSDSSIAFVTNKYGVSRAERMRIDSTGNVGIATASPLAKLEVKGSTLISTTNNGNNILGFNDVAFAGGTLNGAPDGASGSAFIVGNGSTSSGAPSYLSMWTTNFGVVSEKMRITSVGNVGIGTANPEGRLHVEGGAGAAGSQLWVSTYAGYTAPAAGNVVFPGGTKIVLWNDFTTPQKASIGMDTNADIWFNNAGGQGDAGFTFYTGNGVSAAPTARLKIAKNGTISIDGNLGIGTASPTEKLEVRNGNVLVGNAVDNFRITVSRTGANPASLVLGAFTDSPAIEFTGGLGLRFLAGISGTEVMRIRNNNLGIGTADPFVKLHVDGQIRTAAPTGGTAANWRLGTVATVSPTSPNRTIEVDIGGTIYYLHAKTTND